MFNIGERVIYENQGVYIVKNITNSPVDKTDERLFYVLVPEYEPQCNVIVTPTSNEKVRDVISKDGADEMILQIPLLPVLEIDNERNRKNVYREALASLKLEEYIRLIKTVYSRRIELTKNKKRLSETDADYEKRAKHALYSELACVYGISITDVEKLITERIENAG